MTKRILDEDCPVLETLEGLGYWSFEVAVDELDDPARSIPSGSREGIPVLFSSDAVLTYIGERFTLDKDHTIRKLSRDHGVESISTDMRTTLMQEVGVDFGDEGGFVVVEGGTVEGSDIIDDGGGEEGFTISGEGVLPIHDMHLKVSTPYNLVDRE